VGAGFGKVTTASRATAGTDGSIARQEHHCTRQDMNVTLRLDPCRLRCWHVHLAERLARRNGVRLAVEFIDGGTPLPSSLELLLSLERLIYGIAVNDMTMPAKPDALAQYRYADGPTDCVIDFTNAAGKAAGSTLRILFDGIADEAAAVAALLEGRTPFVTIADAATGATIIQGHPGTERADVLTLAWGDVLARTATVIDAALDGAAARQAQGQGRHSTITTSSVAHFGLKSLARAAVRAIYHLCYNAPHWRVGWRFVDGADVIDLRAHPATGWHDLRDDGRRFYADPFPVEHNGRTFVLVEDFVHALGYGVISAVEFSAAGPIGKPRPVLDTGSHLSYPFVFAHGGETWMVPESGTARTIDLYRATDFPGRWIKEATLVSDVTASDATLLEINGAWWMLATVQDGGGAYSDALHIWSASTLLGPWLPHKRNPVMIDIASARPAGRIVSRHGKLIRPVQDCRQGYGSALGLAEITRLDAERYEQRVDTILRPGPLWPGKRLHTLNRAGSLECIDGSARARRF